MSYMYYATFAQEDGMISVVFEDIEDCYTCGETMVEAIENAEDVLAMTLARMESEGKELPAPTVKKICENVLPIVADTTAYKKMYSSKPVKKTLSIPEWLNEEAEKRNVNFSHVLQDSLMHVLGYA